MLTREERAEYRTHYLNRFRNQSIEKRLPVNQTETKEYKRVDRLIKNLEAELRDARHELYELNKAFDTVSREEIIRKRKALIGIRDFNEFLLREVYERAQEASHLTGKNYSYRHELPNAYARVRNWVKNGTYDRCYDERHPIQNELHPLFVEYQLFCSAATVVSHDKANKGQDLHDRVWARRNKLWNEWSDAGRPVRRKDVQSGKLKLSGGPNWERRNDS